MASKLEAVSDGKDKCPYCKGTGNVAPSPSSRIKALRENAGETQQKFADNSGIGRAQIANLETGKTTPSIELLMRIADHYSVSVDWLLGRA
jgi:transcriptional regulator with XRE-family HTH domain